MASESVSVSGPIEIRTESRARVAYDLMQHIASREKHPQRESDPRKYYLELYHACNKATLGREPE